MKTMLTPLRDSLATASTDAIPVATAAVVAAKTDLQAAAPGHGAAGAATPQTGMNAGLIDSLPRSELDALRHSAQNATAPAVLRQSDVDTRFKLRDLTLPYTAFASATPASLAPAVVGLKGEKDLDLGKSLDVNDPGIDPRADLGDGDGLGGLSGIKGPRIPGGVVLPGGVVPGGDPDNNPRAGGDGDGDGTGRSGSKVPIGGDSGGWGLGDFTAFDIDDIRQYYRDPDLDPRAQDGGCGSTGCGTTNTPDCGSTSCGHTDSCGTTSCGATNSCGQTDGCGTTSCGATNSCGQTDSCGTTSCGATNSCGQTDGCGTTSCGDTGACGTTNSPSFDPYSMYTRNELLRQQLATELAVVNINVKQSL